MATEAKAKKPYQIVVGFDFSDLGVRAVEEALNFSRNRAPAELHVVTVAQPNGTLLALPGHAALMTDEEAQGSVQQRLTQIVGDNQRAKGPCGLDRIAIYVLSGIPAGEPGKLITDLASAVDADVIVIGTHGRHGVSRLLLGSVAAHVVRDAATNVYVVRPADFVRGEKVPSVEPPLPPGAPHLKQFEHRRTYHYVDRVAAQPTRTMPVS
jgi:nucleotide-binding universal stress UspA family protein